MSSRNLARRTKAEVSFGGVNITKSIQPYLLSITYTDNEIGDTGATSLSESLKSNTTLTELNLSGEDKRKKTHK